MRLIPPWAGAIPLFAAASAQAQFITPVEGTRSVSATLSATDTSTNISVPVLSIDIGDMDADSVRRRGWLFPGPYTLQGDVSALVDARNTFAGTASASWTMDFQLFCPSDHDVNGTVNPADRDAFLNVWNAGSLDADADGNGVVNDTDRTTFLLAYGSGC